MKKSIMNTMIENIITDESLRLFSKYIHLINSNMKIILLLYNFLFILILNYESIH